MKMFFKFITIECVGFKIDYLISVQITKSFFCNSERFFRLRRDLTMSKRKGGNYDLEDSTLKMDLIFSDEQDYCASYTNFTFV